MEFYKFIKILAKLESYVESKMDSHWDEWPQVRSLAKRYKIKQDDIIDMVESCENLDLIVGGKVGNGIWEFNNKGDYRVEFFT